MTVTTSLETPIYFDAGGDDLFGIFTRPDVEPNGIAVLTIFGAGPFPTLGKNQARVRLARGLAGLGYHALRIDYRGIGESGGEAREPKLSELWIEDVRGAIGWLTAQGFDRILIVGVCFGARTALAMLDEIPGLVGMAMVAPPVGEANHRESIIAQPISWYLKRALSPSAVRLVIGSDASAKRRRATLTARARRAVGREETPNATPKAAHASPQFLEPMAALLGSRTPVLLLYGRGDDFFASFERSLDGRLGRLIEEAGSTMTLHVAEEPLAGLGSIETQDMVLDEVLDFARKVAAAQDPLVAQNLSVAQHTSQPKEQGGLRLD